MGCAGSRALLALSCSTHHPKSTQATPAASLSSKDSQSPSWHFWTLLETCLMIPIPCGKRFPADVPQTRSGGQELPSVEVPDSAPGSSTVPFTKDFRVSLAFSKNKKTDFWGLLVWISLWFHLVFFLSVLFQFFFDIFKNRSQTMTSFWQEADQ